MRILMTGATGFIGKHLLRILTLENHDLLLIVRDRETVSSLSAGKVKALAGNLNDFESVKIPIKEFNPQVVIHLAWQGIPDFSEGMSFVNLQQSIYFFNFLVQETRCRKIIVSGSCFEYGQSQGPCLESQPSLPNSFFTWAKLSLYNYAFLLCQPKGIALIWFRFFYVYGPGQKRKSLIPAVVDSFVSNATPVLNNPFNANDFIFVEDIARALNLSLDKKMDSGIYNLGSGHSTSVIKICEIVEQEILGQTRLSERIKKESKNSQTINFWADLSKTQNAFGWVPPTGIEEGIKQYISSLERV